MPTTGYASVTINKLDPTQCHCTLRVKVEMSRQFKARLWLGSGLIKLGCNLIGLGYEQVEWEEEEGVTDGA